VTDRLPPQDETAERALIGAILRDPDAFDDVRPLVGEDDFHLHAHQVLWRTLAGMIDAGQTPDLVTLRTRLNAAGHLAEVGGDLYLADLWEGAATAANAGYHARLTRDRAARRRLIRLNTEMARDAYDLDVPAEQIVARYEQEVFAVADGATADGPTPLHHHVVEVLADVDDRLTGRSTPALTTGLSSLDQVIGGLHRQRLIILAARPSVGKSALMLHFALVVARLGVGALVISLEMSGRELAQRTLATTAGVPLNVITGATAIDRGTARRLAEGAGECRVPVWIDDRPDHTAETIAATARRAVRKHKVGLLVIDYLQLIEHGGGHRDTLSARIGATTRRLKRLARQLDIPVVLLCQLNREIEHRADGEPKLSDLRDSGEIEQDCDDCLMLWPQDVPALPDGTPAPVQEIRIVVAKQRNGPRAIVSTEYERRFVRFRNAGIPH
jgi:replicative DNA helicase